MMLQIAFLVIALFCDAIKGQCTSPKSLTFVKWSGMSPEGASPVFVYSASGEEESLSGACLARCRELDDCVGVAVAYGKGNCHGVASSNGGNLKMDSDVNYFTKICLELPDRCSRRWWALETTPGYHLHSEVDTVKLVVNTTVEECYNTILSKNGGRFYRSAQWMEVDSAQSTDVIKMNENTAGSCFLNKEDKFTEPESYRVSNYYTLYVENQCRHDYHKKIDRCSYEEYYNQTLKHVDYTFKNFTKDECKTACEDEERFVCRGFSWTSPARLAASARSGRNLDNGLCDLHSEDLITTGSWLLRRTGPATYYRRVICLNISVDCDKSNLTIIYRPRGNFRGRLYVPGRGEACSANARGGTVRLTLPLDGDCDVHFAQGISQSPGGIINRTMAFVMVMVQNNPIIQTAGDRWVRVGCSPDTRSTTQVDTIIAVRDTGKPSSAIESSNFVTPAAASAIFNAHSAPLTMYMVRAHEDPDGVNGAVSLGEPLELRIETTDDNEIEAYHLVASSRLGDSSVLLLDNRGCPTGQVDFPPFVRTWLGETQRLTAKFKAFRFPTSHVVRFALMVRFCEGKCAPVNCGSPQGRSARQINETFDWSDDGTPAAVREEGWGSFENKGGVVAQGGTSGCGIAHEGKVPLEMEMVVGSRDILSADTLVRADHDGNTSADSKIPDTAVVCIHELLLLALALAWLAVQIILLLGCCVLVKRYRNLAEMNMQKEYQSFDNVGFDTVSTHRRVHWPDQSIDMLHT